MPKPKRKSWIEQLQEAKEALSNPPPTYDPTSNYWDPGLEQYTQDIINPPIKEMPVTGQAAPSTPSIITHAPAGTVVNPMISPPAPSPMPPQFSNVQPVLPERAAGQPYSQEDVYFKYTTTGYTKGELEGILGQFGNPADMTPQESAFYLQEHFSKMGGRAPTGYSQTEWLRTQGGRQIQGLTEQLLPQNVRGSVQDWPAGQVSRGGRTTWPVETYTQNWLGVPGGQPGTIRISQDPTTEKGLLKLAKRSQQLRGSYAQPELYDPTGQSMMQESPFKIGEQSPRIERGFVAPMSYVAQEWLPEGMMGLPRGQIGYGATRRTREFWAPSTKPLKFVEPGTYWQAGEGVQPFQGAAPRRFGLGHSADWVSYLGQMSQAQTREVGGEQVEGILYRAQFEIGMSPSTMRLGIKTGPHKFIAPELAKDLPGFEGRGISTIKDPSAMALPYWQAHPEQAAAELGITRQELAQRTWQDIGLQLSQRFAELATTPIEEGGLYREQQLSLGIWHKSQFGQGETAQLEAGRITRTPIEGRPGYYNVQTAEKVGVIEADMFLQGRQGYGVRQQNVPYRERIALQQQDPALHEAIMRESAPETRARMGAIGAALASSGRGYNFPTGTISPTASAVQQMLMRAEQRALQGTGAEDVSSLPEWTLERAVIQEAAATWGESPLAVGGDRVSMAPEYVRRFSVEGLKGGEEVSSVGRAFARTMINWGTEAQEKSASRLIEKQAEFAGGKEFKQKALRGYSRRVIADEALIDPSLPANMVSAPVNQVLEALGMEPGTERAESFEAAWKSGEVTPTGYLYGQPSPGSQVFGGTFGIAHPSTLQGDYELGSRIASGPMGMQAIGRDADGDQIYVLATGRAVVNKAGKWKIVGSTTNQYSTKDVQRMAQEALDVGRPSLARGGGAASAAELRTALDPSQMYEVGTQELEAAFQTSAKYGDIIGPYYTKMEDVKDVAYELGRGAAGERFMRSIHSRTQGRFALPEDLGKTAALLASMTPRGGVRDPMASEKEWDYLKARGILGAQRRLFEYLGGGESLSAGIVAEMMFPASARSEAESLIGRFRKARGKERVELAGAAQQLLGSAEQWVKGTPLGGTVGAKFAGRPDTTAESLRMTEETYQLSQQRYASQQARRAMLTKSAGRAGIEGLVAFEEGLATRDPAVRAMLPTKADPTLAKMVGQLPEAGAGAATVQQPTEAAPPLPGIDELWTDEQEMNGDLLGWARSAASGGGAQGPPIPPAPSMSTTPSPEPPGGGQPSSPQGHEQPKRPGGDIYAGTGGLFKKLNPISPTKARKALQTLMFEESGLPRWVQETLPVIKRGDVLTSGQASETLTLGTSLETIKSFQWQFLGRDAPIPTDTESNLLGQIETLLSDKGMGAEAAALAMLGPKARRLQQAESRYGRGQSAAVSPGILGGVSASELERVSGIGASRSRALLEGRPSSFSEVEAILGGTHVGSSASRKMTLDIANRITPWSRLKTLQQAGMLEELPGVGPKTVGELEEAIAGGGVSDITSLMRVHGISEKKALGIAEALGTPLDKSIGALEKFTTAVSKSKEVIEKHSDVLAKQVEGYRTGEFKPTREWFRGVSQIGQKAAGVVSAAERAGVEAPSWATRAFGLAQQVEEQYEAEGLDKVFGPPPGTLGQIGGALGSVGKKLMSGWGMMQINRMWGLTGKPVFSQMIPAAAQAGMQEWQATQALSGFQGGLPGNIAGGIMEYQAAQRRAMVEAGRTGYRAWGWTQQASGGFQQARAMAGPAVGAGVIAGLGASWAGVDATAGTLGAALGAAALPIGIGVGALALGIGAMEWTRSFGESTAENQLGLATGEISPFTAQLGRYWSSAPKKPLGATQPGDLWGAGRTWEEAGLWRAGETRVGQRMVETPLGGLAQQQQAAVVGHAADLMAEMEGTVWKGRDPDQIARAIGQYATYYEEAGRWKGPEELAANVPEYLATMDVSRYEGLAGQLRLGAGGVGQIADIMAPRGAFQQHQMQEALGILAPLTQFGVSGQEILAQVSAPGPLTKVAGGWQVGKNPWLDMTAEQKNFARRLANRSPYAISQYGQQVGRTDLQTVDPITGMAIGSNWGGDILGGLVGQTGISGINVQGGQITLPTNRGGTQQVDFTRWGLQNYQAEQQYQDQMQQYVFSARQFHMAGDWMQQQRRFQNTGRQMEYDWQQTQFGFQQEAFDLGNRQWQEQFGLRRSQFEATTQYQRENMNIQFGRQMTRLDWAGEDLAFSGQQAALQYGFGMEDIQENLRYATGRQRRELMKQQERQTLMYGLGQAQRETQEERLDTRREWAEEDQERQKSFFEQKISWTEQEMDMALRHHDESSELQQRRMDATRDNYEEEFRFQTKRIEAERKYQDKQRDFQQQQLDFQKSQIQKWYAYKKAVTAANRSIDLHMSKYRAAMDSLFADSGQLLKIVRNFFNTVDSATGGGGYIAGLKNKPSPAVEPQGPEEF